LWQFVAETAAFSSIQLTENKQLTPVADARDDRWMERTMSRVSNIFPREPGPAQEGAIDLVAQHAEKAYIPGSQAKL
jgi:hypothetical protein